MNIRPLTEEEKELVRQRFSKINELQENEICFGCYNFEHGDIFPDDGLTFYEDELVQLPIRKISQGDRSNNNCVKGTL